MNLPRDSVTFSADRIHFIGCYGKWVDWSCGCGRLWRDSTGDGRAGRKGACKAVGKKEYRPEMRWMYRDGTNYEEENKGYGGHGGGNLVGIIHLYVCPGIFEDVAIPVLLLI